MSSVDGRGVPASLERPAPARATGGGDAEQALRFHRRRSAQRILRLAARVTHMGPGEVAHRLRRFARKTVRAGIPSALADRGAVRLREAFLEEVASLAAQGLARLLDERFLYGPQDRTALIAALTGDQRAACVSSARRACEDGVTLLGRRHRLDAAAARWRSDPETGAAWPDTPLDEDDLPRTAADVKYVWELNRHQFLAPLGRAYWLSGDERYVERAAALIDDWIEANPAAVGVNWASALEVGLRSIAWLWALPCVVAWPGASRDFLARWLGSLADHYHFLRVNLSIYTDPTNHLIGEATALWMLSTCFPMLTDSERQARRALAILTHEAERQVAADGIDREQAFGYQRFVLELLLQVVALLRRRQQPVPTMLAQRVAAMLDACAALVDADGALPAVGDGDDGRAMPFLEPAPRHMRHLLGAGALLFDRPEWKALVPRLEEPVLWLLGPGVLQRFADLRTGPVAPASRIFADGGYCVFTATGTTGERRLLFDVGGLGLWPNAAHGHADALSVVVSVDGTRLLDDPGTGSYRDAHVRTALRSTAAHNTLGVDGLDQADAFDAFKWINPPRVHLHAHHVGVHFDYALASHSGYARLRQPVWHTRAVLFIRPQCWLIIDRVEGTGEHVFTRYFNCPPTAVVSRHGRAGVTVRDPETGSGVDLAFGGATAEVRLTHDGLWSGAYGHWQRAPRLALATQGRPPLTFFTLITPLTAGCADGPQSEPGPRGCGGERAAVWRCGRSLVLFNPERLPVDLPDELHSDAALLFMGLSRQGAIERAFIGGAGELRRGDRTVLACNFGCGGAEFVA